MLLKHSSLKLISTLNFDSRLILKVTTNKFLPHAIRSKYVYLSKDIEELPDGFSSYLIIVANESRQYPENTFLLPAELNYIESGDIVRISSDPSINILYRINANINSILITERCNSFCIMCSQPPKPQDDSYLISEWLEALPLCDVNTPEIVISGGEPTLIGDSFFKIVSAIKANLPNTALHILTNGRTFTDYKIPAKLAEINISDMMLGVPLYSDIASIHDYVVQADGAFDETIKGLINMKAYNLRIELRVVIHKDTYKRMPQLARFIARNLQFVDHVALMGLELTGFARANLDQIWIEPTDYQIELKKAVDILDSANIKVKIFNHQYCLLDESIRRFSVKSISDWKNEYISECDNCTMKNNICGGFFSSAKYRYPKNIKAILNS